MDANSNSKDTPLQQKENKGKRRGRKDNGLTIFERVKDVHANCIFVKKLSKWFSVIVIDISP